VTFLGLLLRLGILYLLVRLIWRALVPPRRVTRVPPQRDARDKPSPPLGDDIVDAEWEDIEG
jgi:hypothetical protein